MAIRRLEQAGAVQRVKAPRSGRPPKEKLRLYRSVKFIKEVTESDWRNLFDLGGQNAQVDFSREDDDGDANVDANVDEDNEETNSNQAGDRNSTHASEVPSRMPELWVCWNPDRLLIHVLFDIVERCGISGISLSVSDNQLR